MPSKHFANQTRSFKQGYLQSVDYHIHLYSLQHFYVKTRRQFWWSKKKKLVTVDVGILSASVCLWVNPWHLVGTISGINGLIQTEPRICLPAISIQFSLLEPSKTKLISFLFEHHSSKESSYVLVSRLKISSSLSCSLNNPGFRQTLPQSWSIFFGVLRAYIKYGDS